MNAELEQIKAGLAASPAYGVGTKAFFDAHTVVFPCIVIQVIEPGDGVHVAVGRLKIRCDKDTGPYKKGEEMEVCAYHTFPKNHRVFREFNHTINKWYRWVAAASA